MMRSGLQEFGTRLGLPLIAFATLISPALAGPPYQSDDPEPTDYGHYEIYTFNKGALSGGQASGASGIDFNYGAAPNLQLTATVPAAFESEPGSLGAFGFGNVELAAKYRFLRQDSFGLDVSLFPRLFLPSPSSLGDREASLLLPIWVQKDWGDISAFGGGGCQFTITGQSKRFCLYGATVTRQVLPELQLGVEVFHQTTDFSGARPITTLGAGARYDLSEHYHLLGYVAHDLRDLSTADGLSWYAAVLFTF